MRLATLSLCLFCLGCLGVLPLAAGEGTVVEIDNLKSTAPGSWKMKETASKFRVYQFHLPKAEGDPKDAELVVFFFGPGGGGSLEDNLKRWKNMFKPPEGKTIDDVSKLEKLTISGVEATALDLRGTYLERFPPFDPNAKITPRENYRSIRVFFASKNGPYFITLVGPARTVDSHKKAFDSWLKAFK